MEFRLRTYEGGLLSGPSTTVLQRLKPPKSYQLQQLVDLLLSENLREHVARIHIGPLISNLQRSMLRQRPNPQVRQSQAEHVPYPALRRRNSVCGLIVPMNQRNLNATTLEA